MWLSTQEEVKITTYPCSEKLQIKLSIGKTTKGGVAVEGEENRDEYALSSGTFGV